MGVNRSCQAIVMPIFGLILPTAEILRRRHAASRKDAQELIEVWISRKNLPSIIE
jgi:hypothetical protein